MPELWLGKVPIIRRSLNEGFIRGEPDYLPSMGCIERDYDIDPPMVGASPADIQLLDDDVIMAALKSQVDNESSMFHMYLRNPFELLDQDGFPDCWAHSDAHAAMFDRLRQNLPVVRFNAVAMATLLRQTNGGWCGLSNKFGREHGRPVIGNGPGEWPYQSRKGKDTPELRANMAKYKSTEDYYDLGNREYDQVLTKRQILTLCTQNTPIAADWMKHGHSMMIPGAAIVDNRPHPLAFNSWKGFGYMGFCVMYDQWPNNAVAIRATTSTAGV